MHNQGQQDPMYRVPHGYSVGNGAAEEDGMQTLIPLPLPRHVAPPPRVPLPGSVKLFAVAAVAALVLVLVLAAVVFQMYYHASAQISGLQSVNSNLQATISKQAAANAVLSRDYSVLSGKVSSTSNLFIYLGQFAQSCSSVVTGPDGPGTYYLPCAVSKPAG